MRLRFVLLTAALVLGAWGLSAASPSNGSAAATAACGPFGAKTLAASRQARVYVIGNTAYGCAMRGTGAFRLGQRKTCEGSARVAPVVVAGQLAAYGLERCFIDTGSTEVVVRRLTNGKQIRSAPATSPPGVESFQSVDSIVLKPDGAVAWIGSGSSIVKHSARVEVYEVNAHGSVKLLDSGMAVRTHSLHLHGSTLSWKDGTQTRRARLS